MYTIRTNFAQFQRLRELFLLLFHTQDGNENYCEKRKGLYPPTV